MLQEEACGKVVKIERTSYPQLHSDGRLVQYINTNYERAWIDSMNHVRPSMSDTTKFVHLHTHSHYSLLDGMSQIEAMVKLAKEHGQTAIGLTDHGAMYGAIDFYTKCKKNGIKPIIGVEAYVANRTRFQKE